MRDKMTLGALLAAAASAKSPYHSSASAVELDYFFPVKPFTDRPTDDPLDVGSLRYTEH